MKPTHDTQEYSLKKQVIYWTSNIVNNLKNIIIILPEE